MRKHLENLVDLSLATAPVTKIFAFILKEVIMKEAGGEYFEYMM